MTALRPVLEIDPILEAALKADPPPRSFAELIAQVKGRYPSDVLQALECRPDAHDSASRTAVAIATEARRAITGGGLSQSRELALPHPLDAEWRFTEDTAELLLSAAAAATRSGDAVLLMGVPSIVLAARRSAHDRQFWIMSETNIIAGGLKTLTLGDPRFYHGAPLSLEMAAAILDPPWYLDQFRPMLSHASNYCRVGATLWVSAPQEGVRPGIATDLAEISRLAVQCGLELRSEDQGALNYRTPLFELNALRAAGVGAWLPDWRRGNLLRYVKRRPGRVWPALVRGEGFELTLAGIRLRLSPSSASWPAELMPIYPAEVFPSVSARAPRRSEANLWTSGNRAFAVESATALEAMVSIARARNLWPKESSCGEAAGDLVPIDSIQSLIQNLTALAERELAEAASVAGAGAWNRSVNDARFLNGSWSAFRASRIGTNA